MKLFEEYKRNEVKNTINWALEMQKKYRERELANMVAGNELTKKDYQLISEASKHEYFKRDVEKMVERKYQNIEKRLQKKIGKIERIKGTPHGYMAEGPEGHAELEVIIAGGHNIQRMHYRVLIK